MTASTRQLENPWTHRWAVAVVCATFPLIWVGGLVTSYDAGMAVPDWPNTYGYNLFLYPLSTWISGPWELFIEHGHRLYASLVGLFTIGLVVAAWRCESRAWVRWMSVAALAVVILQGVLGGARVIEDKVRLAMIHGCLGPSFFALTVALAAMTSRYWRLPPSHDRASLNRVAGIALVTTVLAFCQMLLGAQLRHLPEGVSPADFRLVLVFHVATALALVFHVGLLAVATVRGERDEPLLVRPALGLAALIVVQLSLGAATWVTKYGWPDWLGGYSFAAGYVVQEVSRPQAWIATAHVATSALILATSLLVTLRAGRFARSSLQLTSAAPRWAEALR